MSLTQKDFELIEHLLYKNGDEMTISISRSFERYEERIDGIETRIYARLADLDEKVEDLRQVTTDMLEAIREDVREISKVSLE